MSDLVLHLKREYWEAIRDGTKTEEYRLATPYWLKRLFGRSYTHVVLCLGYPRRDDTSKRITRKWQGFCTKEIIHKEFGTEPVIVCAIPVGKGADDE